MQYLELSPPPPLAGIVRCFWFLRGALPVAAPQTVVADGRIEIVLHLAEPFGRVEADGVARRQDEVLAAGQLTRPIHLVGSTVADVVGIRFRTAAAGTVLREDLGALTDSVVPLGDCARALRARLREAVQRADPPATRVAALSAVLLRSLAGATDPVAAGFVAACERDPASRVHESARRFGVSARTLERRVHRATGLRPALLRRVIRFRRAVPMLGAADRGNWSRTALDAGFFDLAHLDRDFRAFAGVSPTTFFAHGDPLTAALAGA
jgi:AraC-like DNA-binding protein